jgi:hypothetical protein
LQEARVALDGAYWLDGQDAARFLGVTQDHLTRELRVHLTHKSMSLRGRGARGVGYAYLIPDLERVRAIERALGCTMLRAVQLLSGVRRLGKLGMLAHIEQQTDFVGFYKPKRKRQ